VRGGDDRRKPESPLEPKCEITPCPSMCIGA
jgi:hypothetical protein